ncbi:MAG TPA: BlaI/MecI/CopY family transcriptional regulator [Actinocrinis sp.]|uniref:BlaI/MecI/CopY family transcriptional regulator n=1 Tax=Actinocrinis sp. TaxID=1920516 RepID=UPI002DDDA9F2|nr:BlaI/MecI/CopY family transcriptional regulator [Actinocrinis sp.]HEV2342580.1 BlaI/MecI/CopY family transcriptional regulator [Actinocrinis sp.]
MHNRESMRKPGRRGHGERESEVLSVVDAAPWALTVPEVRAKLAGDLSYNTVHTILGRLVTKGLVERQHSSRGLLYRTAPQAAQLVARKMQALLERGPDRASVLQSFVGCLDPADEHALRALLHEHTHLPHGPESADPRDT